MEISAELPALAVASVALVTDLRQRRIPNWLSLSAVLAGLALHAVRDGAPGVLVAVGGVALGAAVFLPFYAIRAIGAGDVKLVASLGALLGPQALISVVIYCALAGGLISMLLLIRGGLLQRTLLDIATNPFRLRRGGATAPYGVAIAGGVYLSMVLPKVVG